MWSGRLRASCLLLHRGAVALWVVGPTQGGWPLGNEPHGGACGADGCARLVYYSTGGRLPYGWLAPPKAVGPWVMNPMAGHVERTAARVLSITPQGGGCPMGGWPHPRRLAPG